MKENNMGTSIDLIDNDSDDNISIEMLESPLKLDDRPVKQNNISDKNGSVSTEKILNGDDKAANVAKPKRIFPHYTFQDTDDGPFRIVIEKTDETMINKISVGYALQKLKINNSILDIKKTSKNRVTVYLSKFEDANNIINSLKLCEYKMKAFLPEYFISVKGVVTGIPLDMDENELKTDIETEYEIINVHRLNKFLDGKATPSDRVAIIFRSSILPKYIKMCYVRSRVEAFVRRTIICHNCIRFNHLTNNCKGQKQCSNCSKRDCEFIKKNAKCENDSFCKFCKEKHSTKDEKHCREWKKQNDIKKIMADRGLSYQDVRLELDFFKENRFNVLDQVEEPPNVYQHYAEIKNTIVPRRIDKKTAKTRAVILDSRISKNQNNLETENVFKRKRDEEQGVALQNPHKVDDMERLLNENSKEIQNLKLYYHSFLFFIHEKLVNKENLNEIIFELEKNIKYEYVVKNR